METIHRNNEKPWFAISRALAQAIMSPETLGVLVYLLSKPPDWTVQMSEVEAHFKIGQKQRRRIFQEAETLGYVRREEVRRSAGHFDYIWHVYDSPELQAKEAKEKLTAYPKRLSGNG